MNNIFILSFPATALPHFVIYFLEVFKSETCYTPPYTHTHTKFFLLKLGFMLNDSNIITYIFN